MFQLAWLRITQPRVDTGAFLAFKNQSARCSPTSATTPVAVFGDTSR